GSDPEYSPPGSLTLQFGVTRQNESHRRDLHVSATRPASSTTWSTLACFRNQLVASPACPAPTIATSTDSVLALIPARILVTRLLAAAGLKPRSKPQLPAGAANRYSTRSPSAGSTVTPPDSRNSTPRSSPPGSPD